MAGTKSHVRRLGGRWFSATAVAWAVMDMLSVMLAALISVRVMEYSQIHLKLAIAPRPFALCLLWFAIWVIFFSHSHHLYGEIESRSGINELRLTLQSMVVAGLVLCGTLYLIRGEVVSRTIVLLTIALTTVIIASRRAIWRSIVYARYREGLATRNVLILGSGRVARALRNHLESLRHLGFRFKGFIALSEEELASGDPDIIGTFQNCLPLARGLFVDEIFLSVPADKNRVVQLVQEARSYDIEVRVVPDLYEGLAWNAPVEYVGQFPTIPLHRRSFPAGAYMMKRAIDILTAAVLLFFLLPVLVLISIAIRLDSRGPIFYPGRRIGRKGRMFNCYKFRSMVSNADDLKKELEHHNERDGILFKMTNDPRVTRVGRILRKYSLDELPQLWNVLRGDMSLVGPRPPMASEVEQYDLSHLRRLDVLPGITGLWQVEARQDPSFDSYISLDTAYVENWSVWLDIKILVRTISVVFGGTGS